MKRKKTKSLTLAQQADKHALYLKSVQAPDVEVDFFARTYRSIFKREPLVLCEDFCGTAAICYEWVKPHNRYAAQRRAIGVDLHAATLAWGKKNLGAMLPAEVRERVTLLKRDVRTVGGSKADIISAQNFSFWIFKTRPALLEYFRAARRNLDRDGIFILDLTGGYGLLKSPHIESRRIAKDTRYVWDQQHLDPVTHDCRFAIHFRFADGSEIRNAFEYDWRLWSIPETRELLLEAGFDAAHVYWEDEDAKTRKGNGRYRRRERGTNDPAWLAYVVGVKGKQKYSPHSR